VISSSQLLAAADLRLRPRGPWDRPVCIFVD